MRREFIPFPFDACPKACGPIPFIHAGLVILFVLAIPGCGEEASVQNEGRQALATAGSAPPSKPGADYSGAPQPVAVARQANAPPAEIATSERPSAAVDAAAVAARKIIYDAQVDLVVESISTLTAELTRLVNESGGYMAETEVNSFSEAKRQAKWKIRVPVGRFDSFLTAVDRLGELQKRHLNSQDVTQEFYDLEAQINNKQQEEKRLLKHLADSTGKLDEILTVEKELSRVRGEVEQMQGRIRYLGNMAALSTVTITASEIHGYKPPVTPTFSVRLSRSFFDSLANLLSLGKAIVLFIVVVGPWVVAFAVVLIPLWGIMRWVKRFLPASVVRPPPVLIPRRPGE